MKKLYILFLINIFSIFNSYAFRCSEHITGVNDTDCEALIELYYELNGANWSIENAWLKETRIEKWVGVVIENNMIINIEISNLIDPQLQLNDDDIWEIFINYNGQSTRTRSSDKHHKATLDTLKS